MKRIVKIFIAKKRKFYISFFSNIAIKSLYNIGKGSRILKGVSCSDMVSIGKNTTINGPNTKITAKINKISIGSFCSIAPGVTVQEYYHKYDRISSFHISRNILGSSIFNDIFSKGSIIIEDDVWIGANVIILSGVTIGRGSVIGAGSIVTKDVPRYSIACGNPARVIKSRFNSKKVIDYIEHLRWWDWDVDKIKENRVIFELNEEQLLEKINE